MRLLLASALALLTATPASAGELFGGVYVHGVDTPLTLGGDREAGADVIVGYRGDPLTRWRLEPYAHVAVNTAGETHHAAVGLSRKFGRKLYVRPGLGIAIHTGSAGNFDRPDRIAFGSRILFEPEFGIGTQVNDRLSLEAHLVHLSHAQIFGKQNPGIDIIGARLNWRL